MKYYIPTTTLNFNNILSSESISPHAFYKNRDFGYSRWYDIPENKHENAIILYDSLYNLGRGESELEDHPLIIEIETSETFQEIEKGVYIADKTIYLNPWHTWFIFLSEQDKTVALSLSDSSLETKMVPLYQKKFKVCKPEGNNFPIIKENFSKLNNPEIQHDRIINRLKGMLCGYYIGGLLSCSEKDVKEYAIYKELYNIIISILSNPLREPSVEQEQRISTLFANIRASHSGISRIEELYNDYSKSQELVKILTESFNVFSTEMDPNELLRQLKHGEKENNFAFKWITDKLGEVSLKTNGSRQLLSPNDKEIAISDNKLFYVKEDIISDKILNQLFIGLVNYVLTDNAISGKIASQRFDLATKLTIKAKEILDTDWETSYVRNYMNALRRHINGEEFNHKWDNGVLSSLAAVILKGDDWEVLLDFMKRKGMYDYRIAFAFYGLFNGFANLTRDFTDTLFNNDDRNYVASIYREIYRFIQGERIGEDISLIESDLSTERRTSDKHLCYFKRDEVEKYFNASIRSAYRFTSKQRNLERELKFTLDILGQCNDSYILVCVLNDSPTWKSGNEWKAIRDKFCPSYKNIIEIKRHYDPTLNFPENSPLLREIKNFFTSSIYPSAKEDKRLQLTAELKFVLNRIQDWSNEYIFVCVLNDSKLWKDNSSEWKKMQERFCPAYHAIREKVQAERKNGYSSNKVANTEQGTAQNGTLFEFDPSEKTFDTSDSISPIFRASEKESSFQNFSKIRFRLESLESIFKIICKLNSNLSEKGKDYI